jgi:hypothetical protein
MFFWGRSVPARQPADCAKQTLQIRQLVEKIVSAADFPMVRLKVL